MWERLRRRLRPGPRSPCPSPRRALLRGAATPPGPASPHRGGGRGRRGPVAAFKAAFRNVQVPANAPPAPGLRSPAAPSRLARRSPSPRPALSPLAASPRPGLRSRAATPLPAAERLLTPRGAPPSCPGSPPRARRPPAAVTATSPPACRLRRPARGRAAAPPAGSPAGTARSSWTPTAATPTAASPRLCPQAPRHRHQAALPRTFIPHSSSPSPPWAGRRGQSSSPGLTSSRSPSRRPSASPKAPGSPEAASAPPEAGPPAPSPPTRTAPPSPTPARPPTPSTAAPTAPEVLAACRVTRAAAAVELAEAAERAAAAADRADFVLALAVEKAAVLRDAQGRLAARAQDAAVRGARAAAAVELAEAEGRVAVENEHNNFFLGLAAESAGIIREQVLSQARSLQCPGADSREAGADEGERDEPAPASSPDEEAGRGGARRTQDSSVGAADATGGEDADPRGPGSPSDATDGEDDATGASEWVRKLRFDRHFDIDYPVGELGVALFRHYGLLGRLPEAKVVHFFHKVNLYCEEAGLVHNHPKTSAKRGTRTHQSAKRCSDRLVAVHVFLQALVERNTFRWHQILSAFLAAVVVNLGRFHVTSAVAAGVHEWERVGDLVAQLVEDDEEGPAILELVKVSIYAAEADVYDRRAQDLLVEFSPRIIPWTRGGMETKILLSQLTRMVAWAGWLKEVETHRRWRHLYSHPQPRGVLDCLEGIQRGPDGAKLHSSQKNLLFVTFHVHPLAYGFARIAPRLKWVEDRAKAMMRYYAAEAEPAAGGNVVVPGHSWS
eukprot:TRINITY_DN23838_c0_g2_i2.p1 TRINITY_DN23838_c0_g2~~TRINITY_DN23838_c0_g2_i2.p1  ORF type:complete len:785 (+),score=131.86 TRINITY_DN23838_c0_g2_i2:86-2440(+)